MTIRIKIWHIIALTLILAASFYLGRGKYRSEADRVSAALYEARQEMMDDSIDYTKTINGMERRVSEAEAIVVQSDRELRRLESEYERIKKLRLKDLKSISDLNLEVNILREKLELKDTVFVTIKDTISDQMHDYVRVPLRADMNDRWTDLSILIDRDSSSYNLYIDVPLHGVIGYKRNGLFQKKTPVSVLDTPVPYVNINKNNVIFVDPDPKWYEKKVFWLGAGGLAGVIGTLILL